MRKTSINTKKNNVTIMTASEYFERKRNGEIAPGTSKANKKKVVLTASEYFSRKRSGEIAPGTTQKKNVSCETLTASKPNKETNKPDKKALNAEKREKEKVAFEKILNTVCKKKSRDFVSYEKIPGLYRLYIIDKNNKRKCIARIKLQKDIYVLIREQLACALNYDYDLINYNLPAGIHFKHTEIKEKLLEIYTALETA